MQWYWDILCTGRFVGKAFGGKRELRFVVEAFWGMGRGGGGGGRAKYVIGMFRLGRFVEDLMMAGCLLGGCFVCCNFECTA
jgi:hypothetical protein